MKKYGVTTAMPPYTTLRRLLVHIKSKVEQEEEDEETRGDYNNAPVHNTETSVGTHKEQS